MHHLFLISLWICLLQFLFTIIFLNLECSAVVLNVLDCDVLTIAHIIICFTFVEITALLC